jgi:hypothetical protein
VVGRPESRWSYQQRYSENLDLDITEEAVQCGLMNRQGSASDRGR